jgi:asparagine synthase (glutamine-hydrolysing)
MCGILGIINIEKNFLSKEKLENSINIIHSRGPDQNGFWQGNECTLLHKRLSVIDITKNGSQPMHSQCERYVMVYNGEIYNYLDIKKELESLGVVFKSNTDSEVLINGWAKWNHKIFDKIDGMFSFGIWDKKEKKITIARDRVGEKPLYYYHDNNVFIFSSRPSPIISLIPDLINNYDNQSIRLYLDLGYIPSPYSLHKKLKKVEPATFIEFSEKKITENKYWDILKLNSCDLVRKKTEEDLLEELDFILGKKVKERLISDVPLGAFLSGGVDSSLIVAYMKKYSTKKIKTFSIGFQNKFYDESKYSALVSKHLDTDHYQKFFSEKDMISLIPKFFKEYDEPFADTSAFPTLAISSFAKEQVTVALTGDGGDEFFGGYHYYKIINFIQKLYFLPLNIRFFLSAIIKLIPDHKIKLLSEVIVKKNLLEVFFFIRSMSKDFNLPVSSRLFLETFETIDFYKKKISKVNLDTLNLRDIMILDATTTLSDCYLQKTDVASMAYSLETRSPFLSREIIEFSFKIPTDLKIKGVTTKYLLKKIASKYLPKEIIYRKKQGFEIPLKEWLAGPLSNWAKETIASIQNNNNFFLEKEKIKMLFDLHLSGKRDVHPLLWSILVLINYDKKIKFNH